MTDSHLFRYIIRKNNDTMETLAKDLGISRPALSAKINNRREFKQSEVFFIAKRYSLSEAVLFRLFWSEGDFLCG